MYFAHCHWGAFGSLSGKRKRQRKREGTSILALVFSSAVHARILKARVFLTPTEVDKLVHTAHA